MSNARVPAAIKDKPRRRFYEAVVFLHVVTLAWQRNRQPVSDEFIVPNSSTTEANFKDFVNRLSQFCDFKLGGDFVTAFTVLDFQHRIQYRFACNRANRNQLKKISTFIIDLLRTLRDVELTDGLEQKLLEKVLAHGRVRVHTYLGALNNACRECIGTKPADKASLDQLHQLRKAASHADFGKLEPDIFAQRCKTLMELIERRPQRNQGDILAERPTSSSMNQSSSCWSNLRHYAGRLLSYMIGIRTLMTATQNSPRLVEQFEVESICSSNPDMNPLPKIRTTADEIMRRMVQDPAQAMSYSALLADIRSIDINETIQSTMAEATFRPIVHAELLVLQSLEKDELTHPSKFFNCWKYIGSSKHTCRLCHWYFQEHGGGFQVRPTHGNLYINWKPPDVFQRDGEAAIKARENMLNTIVAHVRVEGLRTLCEKVPLGRLHDSSTGMTLPVVSNPRLEENGDETDAEMPSDGQDGAGID